MATNIASAWESLSNKLSNVSEQTKAKQLSQAYIDSQLGKVPESTVAQRLAAENTAKNNQVLAAQEAARNRDVTAAREQEQYRVSVNNNRRIEDQNNTERTMRLEAQLKGEAANREASRNGGSFTESFGLGAAAPSGYSFNAYGVKGLYDASSVANWRQRQDGVLNDIYMQEKRSSDLDRDKQKFLNQQQANIQADMFQRQTIADNQKAAQERAYQSGQSDKDRANQRYLAQLDANSRMYSSMFNGNGNGFQYWGGSI